MTSHMTYTNLLRVLPAFSSRRSRRDDASYFDKCSDGMAFHAPRPYRSITKRGLCQWKPLNHLFRDVCDYMKYRLYDTNLVLDDHVMSEARKGLKLLEMLSRAQKFKRRDPILVVSCLARVKRDFDIELLLKPMGVMTLPNLLGEYMKAASEAQRGHF